MYICMYVCVCVCMCVLGIASNSNSSSNYTPIFGIYIPQFWAIYIYPIYPFIPQYLGHLYPNVCGNHTPIVGQFISLSLL